MSDPGPAVVVASREGPVIATNRAARQLFGDRIGAGSSRGGTAEPCWAVVGGLDDASDLPCSPGCCRRLVDGGLEHTRHASFGRRGHRYRLSCVPVGDVVVCSVSRQRTDQPRAWERLTEREREVLELLAAGRTTAQIAAALAISGSTVRAHVEHMRVRFGASTRAALVARSLRVGLLT